MSSYLQLLSKHRNAIMGFAIIWIMLFHMPYSIISMFPFSFFKSIGYGGVDIFLFLSGFGLYYSMSKKNFELKQYYRSRFVRIMPEFWLVLIVIFIIEKDFSIKSVYNLICSASTLGYWVWGGRVPFKLWYISCILFFYAIYPPYFKLFKRHGIKVPLIIIGSGLTLILIYALVCILLFDKNNIGGLTILTYARIPIFFIGSIFGHWAKDGCDIVLSKKQKVIGLTMAFMAVLVLYSFIIFIPNGLWICSLYFIPFIVITPVLCIVLALLFDKLKLIDELFAHIGSLSLELYLCHEYLYGRLLGFFIGFFGKCWMACLFVMFLSGVAAGLLFFINKKIIQRII